MLGGGAFDQRHLAPARRAIGRPEVDENRTSSEVGQADACAVERVQSERWRRTAARGGWRCEATNRLQGIEDLRIAPTVAMSRQEVAAGAAELRGQRSRWRAT